MLKFKFTFEKSIIFATSNEQSNAASALYHGGIACCNDCGSFLIGLYWMLGIS